MRVNPVLPISKYQPIEKKQRSARASRASQKIFANPAARRDEGAPRKSQVTRRRGLQRVLHKRLVLVVSLLVWYLCCASIFPQYEPITYVSVTLRTRSDRWITLNEKKRHQLLFLPFKCHCIQLLLKNLNKDLCVLPVSNRKMWNQGSPQAKS